MNSNVKTGLFCCVLPAVLSFLMWILLLGMLLFSLARAAGPCSGLRNYLFNVILTGKLQDAKDALCKAAESAFGDEGAMGDYAYNEEWDCGINIKDYTFESAFESIDNTVTYELKGKLYIFKGGTRAWRNNNPGNIRKSDKAIGSAGGFAVFPNYATGSAEITRLLQSERYSNLSIKDAIFKYAPPSENDSTKYAETVKKNTGLDIERKINTLNDSEIERVVNAIKAVEGYKGGQVIIRNEDGSVDTKQCVATPVTTVNARGSGQAKDYTGLMPVAYSNVVLNFDSNFGDALLAAVKEIQQSGIRIVIISGRRKPTSARSNHPAGLAADIEAFRGKTKICDQDMTDNRRNIGTINCDSTLLQIMAKHGLKNTLCKVNKRKDIVGGDCNHFSFTGG